MKIGVFAYNFEHKKTQEGLLHLLLNGYDVECIFAANPVTLTFYQSQIRVSPKGLKYEHPKKIAKRLGISYHVVVHNSPECEDLIQQYDLDVGIILGARILKENIIKKFKVGIINLHPGILPQNRGLDNIKWAILKGFKQGVSAHLIDKHVDMGHLIVKENIDVYEDDGLVDIFLRIQNKELKLMIKSLQIIESGKKDFNPVEEGNRFKAVPLEIEKTLPQEFENYKKGYTEL